jgi:hypothetical protein
MTKEEWDAQNEKHAANPQRGDYWQEMFCPVLIVLGRVGNRVLICDKTKSAGPGRWSWDVDGDGVKLLTLDAFRKELTYSTNTRFYCDVVPHGDTATADYFDRWLP